MENKSINCTFHTTNNQCVLPWKKRCLKFFCLWKINEIKYIDKYSPYINLINIKKARFLSIVAIIISIFCIFLSFSLNIFSVQYNDNDPPIILFPNLINNEIYYDSITPQIEIFDKSRVKSVIYLNGKVWDVSKVTKQGKYILFVYSEDKYHNSSAKQIIFILKEKLETSLYQKLN